MSRLGVGKAPDALDVHTFARLFISLRALRRGVVLDSAVGHSLLRPEQLSPEEFTPPLAEFDAAGAHYTFWMFDIDSKQPIFWAMRVAPDGTTHALGDPFLTLVVDVEYGLSHGWGHEHGPDYLRRSYNPDATEAELTELAAYLDRLLRVLR